MPVPPRSRGAGIRHAGPVQTGPHDAITDVAGVRVGHTTRDEPGWLTGVTVVVPPPGTVGGVDVRGGGPGTRETDLLDPRNLVSAVDAVVLAGGSAFGLAAADGVAAAAYEAGAGWPVGPEPHERVPIVPAAILFDLGRGGSWLHHPGRGRRRRRLPVGRSRTRGPGLGRCRHRGAHRGAARRGGHGIRGARLRRHRRGPRRRQLGRRRVRCRRAAARAPPRGRRGPAHPGPRPGRRATGRRWPRRPSGCGPARPRPWPSWRPT